MKTYLNIGQHDRALALSMGAEFDPHTNQLYVPDGRPLDRFASWLPQAPGTALAPRSPQGMSLTDLLTRVSGVIKTAFSDPVWVRIEISQLRSHGGTLYIGAVERDENGTELAKAGAQIWSSHVTKLVNKFTSETGVELAAGIKVLVLVKPGYHPKHGFSLQIVDIDPAYTLGDMEARLKRIREKLAAAGIANLNKRLPTPSDFQHVVVISPPDAAGRGDFKTEADKLARNGLCAFTYIDATFQGDRAKDSLRDAFVQAHGMFVESPYCALVVIRGGGAVTDLHWLNEWVLAGMVCKFPCPVLVGIGHERDSTILDECANRSFGTPSKVAGFLKDSIRNSAMQAHEHWVEICTTTEARLGNARARSEQYVTETRALALRCLDRARHDADMQLAEVRNGAKATLTLGEARAHAHFSAIAAGASNAVNIMETRVDNVLDAVKDLARSEIQRAEVAARNDFDSIKLAVRRSIDGIDEHLSDQWRGIASGALNRVAAAEADVQRHIADVRLFSTRTVDRAEQSARDLMSGILSHGVEPTLRRGFAIVKAPGGAPLSSKAAASSVSELEIEFKDGTMNVIQKDSA